MARQVIVRPTVFRSDLPENGELGIASHQEEAEDQDSADDGHEECKIMTSVGWVVEVRGDPERRSDGARTSRGF